MRLTSDAEMFRLVEEKLYTAVCCDIMDDFGYRNQAMRHNIRPIKEGMVVVGRAKTMLAADVYSVSADCYKHEIEALDSVRNGEVVVVSTNNSESSGIWGELLTTATKARGGRGAVIDGMGRDIKKILALDFPVFMVGYRPLDSKGRLKVIDYDCPIVCGGVKVEPGDLIFGDLDGVIAIPKAHAQEIVAAALEKVAKESRMREELLAGSTLAEVYTKYGIL